MRFHALETVTDRFVLWDITNQLYIRENPKITMLFTGAGILVIAKLVTLSVITPFSTIALIFAAITSIPVGYLIWGLANSIDSIKDAFGSYANIQEDSMESAFNLHPMTALLYIKRIVGRLN